MDSVSIAEAISKEIHYLSKYSRLHKSNKSKPNKFYSSINKE